MDDQDGPPPVSVPPSADGGAASPSVSTNVTDEALDGSDKYIPIYVLTGVFGAIFAFGPLLVRKGPNRQIIRVCIMMSAFCMYVFWVTAYISQMNPLTGPRLHNTTIAWYQYKFGKKVATPKKFNKTLLMFDLDLIDDIDEDEEPEPPDTTLRRELKPPKRTLTESKPRGGLKGKDVHHP